MQWGTCPGYILTGRRGGPRDCREERSGGMRAHRKTPPVKMEEWGGRSLFKAIFKYWHQLQNYVTSLEDYFFSYLLSKRPPTPSPFLNGPNLLQSQDISTGRNFVRANHYIINRHSFHVCLLLRLDIKHVNPAVLSSPWKARSTEHFTVACRVCGLLATPVTAMPREKGMSGGSQEMEREERKGMLYRKSIRFSEN